MPRAAFLPALGGASVTVIAELKRRSPSRGAINEGMDLGSRALSYAAGGANAMSVLTEPSQFGGSVDDLEVVARATRVPLLRKDFVVHRLQLLEARAHGASAVLLIARALPPALFASLALDALAIGLDLLLEVRDESELERALSVEHAAIGVNNRDLETLVVDHDTTARLLPLVPRDRIAVYESGVSGRRDVEHAAGLGADAVLVGSSLSLAADPIAAVTALAGVRREARAG